VWNSQWAFHRDVELAPQELALLIIGGTPYTDFIPFKCNL
jgi:hypothetical protein